MSDSFDYYKRVTEETMNTLYKKQEILQRENDNLKQQVNQLQMQMFNLMGSICLDATCKLRKMNFQVDPKENTEEK